MLHFPHFAFVLSALAACLFVIWLDGQLRAREARKARLTRRLGNPSPAASKAPKGWETAETAPEDSAPRFDIRNLTGRDF